MQASPPLRPITIAAPAVVAIAIGIGVTMVPTGVTLFAILAMLSLLFLLAVRAAITSARTSPRTVARTALADGAATRDTPLRVASRTAYVIGLALMGVQLVRPALGLTLSDAFFLLATLGAAILVVRERTVLSTIYPPLLLVGAVLFATGTAISTIGVASPGDSLVQLVKFLFIIIGWFGAGVILLDAPRHVVLAVVAWVATVAANGVAALIQLGFGDVIPGATAAWGRMAGLTDHFNDLGGSAGIAVPAAIMLAVSASGWRSAAAWVACGLVGIGLFLSGSVGGVVAAVLGSLALLATGRVPIGRKTLVVGTAGLFVALVGAAVLSTIGVQTPLARIDVAAGAGGTFASRVQTYEQALWSIGLDPIVGQGLAQGPTRTGYEVHSLLLGAWYQTGIVGMLGIFLIVVGGVATAIVAARRHSEPPFSLVVAGLVGSYAGFLVLGLAQPILYQRYAWVPLALLLALAARPRRRSPRDEAPPAVFPPA